MIRFSKKEIVLLLVLAAQALSGTFRAGRLQPIDRPQGRSVPLPILLLSASFFNDCSGCTAINVTVSGFRSVTGEGFLALYSSPEGYPLDGAKAVRKLKAPIENGDATFALKGVAPGNYALIAMHDENRNGKMDRNLLGMPKEGYGASNNPSMPLFGPPTYESAVFKTTPGVMTMKIRLHYYPH